MKNFKFFTNFSCEYFPCHSNTDKQNFNCLFCYCPLYLIDDCLGTPSFLANGIKDCSNCDFPHKKENYEAINKKLYEYIIGMKVKDEKQL